MAYITLLASAVLATSLAPGASSEDAPGLIQLFPAGDFAARDGRPASIKGSKCSAWRMTAEDAAALIARWEARATPVVIDYEHQTHLAEKNGQPAPAAGWITALDWVEGSGLFATVEWTARARAHIAAKEYRFISPTFHFDPASGVVLEIASAALTNNPALDGMDAVQAKNQGDNTMNEKLLALLRTVLGLPATADEAACEAALAALPPQSLPALLTAKDAEIASLKTASPAQPPDPAHFAPVALLTATQSQLAAVQAELTALKASTATAELTAEIEAALTDGRLYAQGKEWATALATSNPEALRTYLKTAPPIAALKGQQTAGVNVPDAATASLTAEDEYVCDQLGIAREDYLKAKEGK